MYNECCTEIYWNQHSKCLYDKWKSQPGSSIFFSWPLERPTPAMSRGQEISVKLAGYVPWHTFVICARLQAHEMCTWLAKQFLLITSNSPPGFLQLLTALCADVITGKVTEAYQYHNMAFDICTCRQPSWHYRQREGLGTCTVAACKRRVDWFYVTAGLDPGFGFAFFYDLRIVFAFTEHFYYRDCDRSASGT